MLDYTLNACMVRNYKSHSVARNRTCSLSMGVFQMHMKAGGNGLETEPVNS